MRLLVVLIAISLQATPGNAADPARADRLELVAGGGTGGDGVPALEARLVSPFGVGFDARGVLIFVEMTGHRVRKIGRDGLVTTLAGAGRNGSGGDDGPAALAELNGPHSLAVTHNGDIFVADTWNNRVRKIIASTGLITNVAGTGRKGFSGDGGPADAAEFGGIYCLALDEPGQTLYLADLDNRRVRRLDLKTGVVSTVAGNGQKGVPNDGDDARSAPLVDPRAVALDGRGNLYILERSGHALRVVDRSGKIRTVAGTGKPGDSGDGGDARTRPSERPQAPLRRRPRQRADRRHREPPHSGLSPGGWDDPGRGGHRPEGAPREWAVLPESRAQPAARSHGGPGGDPLHRRQQQRPDPQDRAMRARRSLGLPRVAWRFHAHGNTRSSMRRTNGGTAPGTTTPPGPYG